VSRIKEEITRQMAPVLTPAVAKKPKPVVADPGSEVLVRGQRRMLTRLARCCQPVPGDPIIGYLTRGRGVSVHRLGCPNEKELSRDPERLIEVSWDTAEAELAPHPVELKVYAWDRPGLLADVANVVADSNIIAASAKGYRDHTAVVDIRLEVRNLAQLHQLMGRLENLPYVQRVDRVSRERA
jgi:guanosine-3',5'-bis(diphosphate) 3'-pyrophosphohydrolase